MAGKEIFRGLLFASALSVGLAACVSGPESSTTTIESTSTVPIESTAGMYKALLSAIARVESGGQANVTAGLVPVPGSRPGTQAEAQPIVFKQGEETFYAFRQQQKPTFNESPADVIDEELTVVLIGIGNNLNIPEEQAHLNAQGVLVNQDNTPVGYSFSG